MLKVLGAGSLMSLIASLTVKQRRKLLGKLSETEAQALLYDWEAWARPEQLPPDGDWFWWLYLGGRGTGKTRTGAEWVRQKAKTGLPGVFVGQTPADARDIMIEGPSGILNVGPPNERPAYYPAKRLLVWPNGCVANVRSGADPDGLRGINSYWAWCDEFASWEYPKEALMNLEMGMRLGDHPQGFISTTPKPKKVLKDLTKREGVVVTRGSTYDNAENLAPGFILAMEREYEGTEMGRQELHAALLTEMVGAHWSLAMIENHRMDAYPEPLIRTVVAVDPAITAKAESNETGIVVCAMGANRHFYVLADRSGRMKPDQWARRVVAAAKEFKADRIVCEANQGGDMVSHTIRTVDPHASIRQVHATQGKMRRAEPIAALYEQGKVHHVGMYEQMEDQMCTWDPLTGDPSPDRLDALVWGLTELKGQPVVGGISGITDENYWSI